MWALCEIMVFVLTLWVAVWFKGDTDLFRPHHIVESPPEACQCACPLSPRHTLYLEIKYGSWKWEIDWYALSSRNQDYCNIPEVCRLAPLSTMASFSRRSHPLTPPPVLEQVRHYIVVGSEGSSSVVGSFQVKKNSTWFSGTLSCWNRSINSCIVRLTDIF